MAQRVKVGFLFSISLFILRPLESESLVDWVVYREKIAAKPPAVVVCYNKSVYKSFLREFQVYQPDYVHERLTSNWRIKVVTLKTWQENYPKIPLPHSGGDDVAAFFFARDGVLLADFTATVGEPQSFPSVRFFEHVEGQKQSYARFKEQRGATNLHWAHRALISGYEQRSKRYRKLR